MTISAAAARSWIALAEPVQYLSAGAGRPVHDRTLTILALVGISMPVFWLAAILLLLQFQVQLFPHGSYITAHRGSARWAYHLISVGHWRTVRQLLAGCC